MTRRLREAWTDAFVLFPVRDLDLLARATPAVMRLQPSPKTFPQLLAALRQQLRASEARLGASQSACSMAERSLSLERAEGDRGVRGDESADEGGGVAALLFINSDISVFIN